MRLQSFPSPPLLFLTRAVSEQIYLFLLMIVTLKASTDLNLAPPIFGLLLYFMMTRGAHCILATFAIFAFDFTTGLISITSLILVFRALRILKVYPISFTIHKRLTEATIIFLITFTTTTLEKPPEYSITYALFNLIVYQQLTILDNYSANNREQYILSFSLFNLFSSTVLSAYNAHYLLVLLLLMSNAFLFYIKKATMRSPKKE